jgi:glycosyltransferase involved in cell wall biosynthesis
MYPISVVIPVFNEENGVLDVLNNLKNVLDSNGIIHEIIVVNDGSQDNSRTILEKIDFIKLINHPYNKGYGAALKTGIKNSKFDYICIIDADETYPVDSLPELYKYIEEYDMVVGARTGDKVDIPLQKKWAKYFITKLANYLVGTQIPDLNSGMRIFKKEAAMANMNILPSGFSFTTTITCAMMTTDYFVKFVPINYFKRTGESKIRPMHAFEFFLLVIRLITYFKPLKIFAPVSFIVLAVAFLRTVYTIITRNQIHELSIVLIMLGLILFMLGLISDMFVKSRYSK